MQYRLRTLLIVLALGPPGLAFGWWHWEVRFLIVWSAFALACGLVIATTFNTAIALIERLWHRR